MAELQQPTVDTGSILSQLGLTSDQVLQQPTVQATLTNTNDSDALGIFSKQDELAGVAGYQTAYKTAQERRFAGEGLANQEQLTIEGRRKRLGVLRGEQQQAAQLAQADINTLIQGEQLAQSALSSAQQTSLQKANILYNEYQMKNNLLLQYPGLDINPLKDSFEDISEEIGKYTEKQKYIEVLREYGKNTKGSRGLLKKRYRSLLKNLDEEEEAEAEKLERRADEKWELEKRNIRSLINSRASGGSDGFDPKSYGDVMDYVTEGLLAGDDWPTIYETMTIKGRVDPELADKVLKVATGNYQVGADAGGRSAF